MKSDRITRLGLILALTVGLAVSASAKTIVISFGGTLGNEYSPNSTSIELGDTVQWAGTFSAHPLSSISVPPGAQSFHQQTGSVFSYVPKSSGTYEYHCDLHYGMDMIGMGMYGLFTVKARSAIISSQSRLSSQTPLTLSGVSFGPRGDLTFSVFTSQSAPVKLSIVRFDGRTAAVLANNDNYSGMKTLRLTEATLTTGRYCYILSQGSARSSGVFSVRR